MSVKVHVMYDAGEAIHPKTVIVDEIQDYCPLCHKNINADQLSGWYVYSRDLQVMLRCPNDKCSRLFIAYYRQASTVEKNNTGIEFFFRGRSLPWQFEKRKFSLEIEKISKDFCQFYNEAQEAEIKGLENICGAGYRKAIEFLIKDYLIKKKRKKKADIQDKWLGKCINEDIDDTNIKACVERAVWLGNDATHYYRKWKKMDLVDLKNLIEVTLRWIETESITKKYKKQMPKGKNPKTLASLD